MDGSITQVRHAPEKGELPMYSMLAVPALCLVAILAAWIEDAMSGY